MSLTFAILTGLAMGIVFGFALEKARVFEPGVIVGQMQLRNFIMLKVFLAAVATGAVVFAGLNGFGLVKLVPKAAIYGADVVGGLLLGIGIALAGACPGTVMAQIGAGYRDALFVLAGGIAGAIAYSYAEPSLTPLFAGGHGKITFADLAGMPYWPLALVFAALLVVALILLERWRPWRDEIGRDHDGDLPAPGRKRPRGEPSPRAAGSA